MNVTLRSDLQERVKERVQNGEYENADALVQQALDWFLNIDDKEERERAAVALEATRAQFGRSDSVPVGDVFEGMHVKCALVRQHYQVMVLWTEWKGRVKYPKTWARKVAKNLSLEIIEAQERQNLIAKEDNQSGTDTEALTVASRIASMADREVRQRYHELVDKRLESELTVLERFELERIVARLDAEDRDPQIEARDRQWETERTELVQSIEDLLLKLRK
jgi:Arc/MetJ-type ribon-helix-helix transcriptional regulator